MALGVLSFVEDSHQVNDVVEGAVEHYVMPDLYRSVVGPDVRSRGTEMWIFQ